MAITHIAVSVGSASSSLVTAKYAIYLARVLKAKLYAIHVIDENMLQELLKNRVFVEVEVREFETDLEEQGKIFMERLKQMAQDKGIECDIFLLRGNVSHEVTTKLKELSPDLLVIGELKEVKSIKEVFYNTGEKIFREIPCPVVVAKNQALIEKLYREI
jgi:nucleotide-binding universal stress UspA family protein